MFGQTELWRFAAGLLVAKFSAVAEAGRRQEILLKTSPYLALELKKQSPCLFALEFSTGPAI